MMTLWRALSPRRPNGSLHAYQRGQVIPATAMFMSIFILMAWFLIDVAGVQNVAGHAVAGALRAGGLAALQERGTLDDYGRWYVCPPAGQGSAGASCTDLDGDTVARHYVYENLVGDPSLGAGGYVDIFGSTSAADTLLSSGTNGGTQDGLDVEILDPAAQDGQIGEAFLNGVAESVATSGVFPESMQSSITGDYYDTATIILRIRIPDRHVLGTFGTINTTVVVRAGTDAS